MNQQAAARRYLALTTIIISTSPFLYYFIFSLSLCC